MDRIKIFPASLNGKVIVPSSKSLGHREIVCAGLAEGVSLVSNISMSADIEATCRCLSAMGASIEITEKTEEGRTTLRIKGMNGSVPARREADCGESGSTLRFLVPIAALRDEPFTFRGHGKLVVRPMKAYYDIFEEQGLFYATEKGGLPLTVKGRLQPGVYRLPGNVSSQYVSGLLLALPLLEGGSVIEITSPLESSAYVDLTLSCLEKYGVAIVNEGGSHRKYLIAGGQRYAERSSSVEGDWSQAAFWLAAGALGTCVETGGLSAASLQGDKIVTEIMERMGADIQISEGYVTVSGSSCRGTTIDASGCPDIIPVLTALAAVSEGVTEIINAGRLRLKECDRLTAISEELNKMGAKITEFPESLIVQGKPEGLEGGVEVNAWNDHRIAMSLAVCVQRCRKPVVLSGAGSVEKSYPRFWDDYVSLGGRIEVLT